MSDIRASASARIPDSGEDDQLFKLISAAAGDAERGDVVAALREQGVDTLDLLVAVPFTRHLGPAEGDLLGGHQLRERFPATYRRKSHRA
jgi:hypothetical protein